ncbi:unnamed protein product [Echinostoma caproni]|uniref:Nucleolar protein 12 n=1 Tax=Echinostoma caproni TaxID=27848 RepID=A0A183B525_9TREM|nr:unnamed protein product [Echinostoma caproni]
MRKPKGPKLSLVFDEDKRREYLTGFRKRKLERKKKGRELAQAKLAEEIRAVKMKYREAARKRLAGLGLADFMEDNNLDTVVAQEERIVGDRKVTFEHIDLSNSHYFMGSNKADIQPQILPDVIEKPSMSLKAALKMNPSKKKLRNRGMVKKRHGAHSRTTAKKKRR